MPYRSLPRPVVVHRESARERGYDRAWEKTRARFLAEFPLCQDCEEQGRVKAATEVHHAEKIKDAPEKKHQAENLRALCKECHSVRTFRGE